MLTKNVRKPELSSVDLSGFLFRIQRMKCLSLLLALASEVNGR